MTLADVQADSLVNPTCFKVHIKCSKTKGPVCPTRALGNFLALRGSSKASLFTFTDGRPLTRQQLSSTVQSILHSAGYTGSYSGHSFCIGAATTAAARGVPDHLIKTIGRWSSDAYQIYIHTPVSSIIHVSRQLAAQKVPLLPLGLLWGWVPQVWARWASGSAAPSPLASGFLPGGPFGLAHGGSWLGCGLVGLWVFFRFGVYCGCSSLAHGHQTSNCDAGVKYY